MLSMLALQRVMSIPSVVVDTTAAGKPGKDARCAHCDGYVLSVEGSTHECCVGVKSTHTVWRNKVARAKPGSS